MNRTQRSAWNLAAGLAFALTSAAGSLFSTPLLLRWLGAERLGAFKAITGWIGYLTFFELGLGGAIMAALAVIGQYNQAAITRMLAAGLRAYSRVTFAQIAGGIALVAALPHLISVEQVSEREIRNAGAVAILPVLLTPLLVFRALAESRQRGYLNWLLLTAQVLVTTGLSLLAARIGGGLTGQAAALAAGQVPTLLLLAWDGIRAYHGVWTATPERTDQSTLWELSRPTFVHALTDRIGLVSDNIIIAWMLGSAAVVPFFATQQLAVLAQFVLRGFGQATWAGLADLYARGDALWVRMRLVELTGLVSGVGLAALVAIAAYNRSFVHLWVGSDAYAGEGVTLFACVNALLWAVYTLWGWALLGAGQIRLWAPFAVLSTLINIIVSVIGTATLSLVGPLLGTTSGFLLIGSWALPRALNRVFGIPPWKLWRAALAPFVWGLPLAAALRFLAAYYQPEGWLQLFSAAVVSSGVGLLLWWKFSLTSEERSNWRDRLRKVV